MSPKCSIYDNRVFLGSGSPNLIITLSEARYTGLDNIRNDRGVNIAHQDH